ncbi:hypothetical protein FIU85_21135 (plasmid) [Roseovarius sp. THAF8]|uniref:hypothetical protein n=1 Tax=Roseovarius sp. THAF8 TaxID=2587846 RepID=UPI0012679924|nr:hypothetical protein [Roseovarius sp. THAF8]QFT99837.1 hypothetical protein FIU85_21135 [Roseovarius sp. THAF8]
MDDTQNSKTCMWRSSAEEMRRDYNTIALAGLRAQHYAGVFHKVERAKNPTFLATIELDGFERRLEVKFTSIRKPNGQSEFKGMLSGLRVSKAHRHFELFRKLEGSYLLQGTIDLPGACLIIGVLPSISANEIKVYICHIEVVRDHE